MIDLKDLDKLLDENEKQRSMISAKIAQCNVEISQLKSDYDNCIVDCSPFLDIVDKGIKEATDTMRSNLHDYAFDANGCLHPLAIANATQKLADIGAHMTFNVLVEQKGGAELILLMSVGALENKLPGLFKSIDGFKYYELKSLCAKFELCSDEIEQCTELFEKKRFIERKSFVAPSNVLPDTTQSVVDELTLKKISDPNRISH